MTSNNPGRASDAHVFLPSNALSPSPPAGATSAAHSRPDAAGARTEHGEAQGHRADYPRPTPAPAPKGPARGLALYPCGEWARCWRCQGTGVADFGGTLRGPCPECRAPKDALDRIAWDTRNEEGRA